MADLELYRRGKAQLAELVSSLDDATLGWTCRACPDWSLRDVVAHHIHFLWAVLADELPPAMLDAIVEPDPGARSQASEDRDRWTGAGVAVRRDVPMADVLREWDELESSMPESAAHTAIDLIMHLYDVKETLGERERDPVLVLDALESYYRLQCARFKRLGLAPLKLVCRDSGVVLERRAGAFSVTADTYDLLRCVGGRRRRDEADGVLAWGDTPEAARQHFSVYGWA